MLFPYVYVPHSMEKMQGFIDFIFFEVWCKAPVGEEFGIELFAANPDLKEIIAAFGFASNAPIQGKAFYRSTKTIYESFATLSAQAIQQIKKWYWGNNDLKKICANNPAAHLAHYTDIDAQHPELGADLAAFFKNIYSQDLLNLAVVRAKIGEIDDHYKIFRRFNHGDKCPFCGLSDLLGPDHGPREAYDHYLPKALYPFNSINFHNLLPTCHHCNSSYKGSKDPAYSPKVVDGTQARRKLFYPFAPQPWHVDLQVTLKSDTIESLTPDDIALDFGPAELTEQIETWKDVYGIEERYRAKLCAADAKAWLVAMEDEWRWHDESGGDEGKPPETYLRDLARHATRSPYADTNFLKHAFLQACAATGMFRATARSPARTSG
jgi:hypothetical protein